MSADSEKNPNNDDLWLEDVEGEKALQWANTESEKTKSELQHLPLFDDFKRQALEILLDDEKIPDGFILGNYFYNLWQDEKNIQGLLRRVAISKYEKNCAWQPVLDLDQLSERENEKWVFKSLNVCHNDDSRALITLSRGGKDACETREFDMKNFSFIEDGFFLPEGKNATEWIDRDRLLVGTDFDNQSRTNSGYTRKIKIWQRGENLESLKDKPVFFEMPQEEMGCWVHCQKSGEETVFFIDQVKAFYSYRYHWTQLSENEPQIKTLNLPDDTEMAGWHQGQLIFHLCSDWSVGEKIYESDSVLSASLEVLSDHDKLLTSEIHVLFKPTKNRVFQHAAKTKDGVLIATLENVTGKVQHLSFIDGQWQGKDVELSTNGHTQIRAASSESEVYILSVENFTRPTSLFRCSANSQNPLCFALSEKFNSQDLQIEQRWATSADGTKVPYFLVGKDLQSGPAPTLQYGYGGFQVALAPSYAPTLGRLWLERGGRYVFTNIRGGGEFGPQWHKAALKFNRHKCYEDFAAISEQLISDQVTTAEQLAISGGSNGGLLVGAMLTRRPDLYRAVLCDVPLLDMIRYTKLLAGASWSGEYGDPEESEKMREYLLSYSPYHNVFENKKYPRTFVYTSTKDDRVHPGHARRMAAKMIAQGHDALYLENTDGGHGRTVDPNKTAEWIAMRYAFLWNELSKKA